ncbi:TetR/AcrR family transcriptional regulator [Stutzerimonas xanthomarina]|uniref:Transcriptional regulator, TetR family n=2 Tax=Stutzerimonas xanthomarina TaxID=271420 RepID=A0A1M5KYK0_9GAMM|nr:TetR/AcrR family transcriptional regulator [Stutzerimonas xanthomarina]MCP9337380.1 TetR/AcrR family transcriptional regulator [Stutzerimonas xanthomarina]SEH49606.1 DNA-binding transcriptional regulator, AcrR family [Stutzerimonas xanthomarina]SHG57816.1 transcriptional regulator, TetR family [Stutzerimonas xanthomarina DSM 18231]
MSPKPSTRERILLASLELFNAQGERSVTTNHIAAHLEISPGNLYYHFRNKQAIIAELFDRYERNVDGFLQLPEGRALTIDDKTGYLEALLSAMWDYRFVHRDLEHLLSGDDQLAERYRWFARRHLLSAQKIYQGFVDAGILQMTPPQVEALAVNAWIIMTSWVPFLCTVDGSEDKRMDRNMLRRGIFQLLTLEEGFVTDAARPGVSSLLAQLHAPLING